MAERPILVLKTGTVSPAGKKALAKAGLIAIESDDPGAVRFLAPSHEIDATEMLGVAMTAIKRGGGDITKRVFADLFTDLVASALERKAAPHDR